MPVAKKSNFKKYKKKYGYKKKNGYSQKGKKIGAGKMTQKASYILNNPAIVPNRAFLFMRWSHIAQIPDGTNEQIWRLNSLYDPNYSSGAWSDLNDSAANYAKMGSIYKSYLVYYTIIRYTLINTGDQTQLITFNVYGNTGDKPTTQQIAERRIFSKSVVMPSGDNKLSQKSGILKIPIYKIRGQTKEMYRTDDDNWASNSSNLVSEYPGNPTTYALLCMQKWALDNETDGTNSIILKAQFMFSTTWFNRKRIVA